MWDWASNSTFTVLQVVPNDANFNYFFTLVTVFGLISTAVVLMIKLITRT